MRVNDIKLYRAVQDALKLAHHERQMVRVAGLVPDGLIDNGFELGRGCGVAAGEQCHVVSSTDELLRERVNHSLGATVLARWHPLERRSYLGDSHNTPPSRD